MVLVCDWKGFEWQSSSTLRSLTPDIIDVGVATASYQTNATKIGKARVISSKDPGATTSFAIMPSPPRAFSPTRSPSAKAWMSWIIFQRQWSQWRRSVLMILRVHLLSVIGSFRHLLDRCRNMCARLWSNNRDVKDYLPQRSPGQCQAMEWWSSSTSPRLITCFFRHPKDLPAIHVNTQKRFLRHQKFAKLRLGAK